MLGSFDRHDTSISMGNRALLIGVVKKADGQESLEGADVNANRMADLLTKCFGFAGRNKDIKVLVDPVDTTRDATRIQIRDWLLRDMGPTDVRVLALSAHGVSVMQGPDVSNDLFIMSDTHDDRSGFFQSEIDDLITAAPNRGRVYCLFDSCRSKYIIPRQFWVIATAAMKRARIKQPIIDVAFFHLTRLFKAFGQAHPACPKIIEDESRPWIVLKACAFDQQATYDGANGGVFTRFICDILQNQPDSHPVDLIRELCKDYLSAGQDPEIRGPKDWLSQGPMFR